MAMLCNRMLIMLMAINVSWSITHSPSPWACTLYSFRPALRYASDGDSDTNGLSALRYSLLHLFSLNSYFLFHWKGAVMTFET